MCPWPFVGDVLGLRRATGKRGAMSDLFDDPEPGQNSPEFSVSDIAGAVKRVIEGEFGHVRVRGEISRVSRPASGHLYFELKDDRSVLASVMWKGVAAASRVRPEEGMEVVATGKLTTFGSQSKYQLVVESLAPAGLGALMVMLEKRRKALEAEGLFEAGRKRPLPYLPEVIGVVTSPSGAVIRDILHRLRERFPRQVLIWPVVVQGEKCAGEVAAAIHGFNAIAPGGPVPRPDVLIVARGGGSIEDLWGFNEEIVVRAVADSVIPVISAVGHETDTTLIDYVADRRAPTPSAAAEMAVPVRADLLALVAGLEARRVRGLARMLEVRRQRLRDLARTLPRIEALVPDKAQRLDQVGLRLPRALLSFVQGKRVELGHGRAGSFGPGLLRGDLLVKRNRLADRAGRLEPGVIRLVNGLHGYPDVLLERMKRAVSGRMRDLRARLDGLERTRATLGTAATLKRGFAIVWGGGKVVAAVGATVGFAELEVQFHDGRLGVVVQQKQGKLI